MNNLLVKATLAYIVGVVTFYTLEIESWYALIGCVSLIILSFISIKNKSKNILLMLLCSLFLGALNTSIHCTHHTQTQFPKTSGNPVLEIEIVQAPLQYNFQYNRYVGKVRNSSVGGQQVGEKVLLHQFSINQSLYPGQIFSCRELLTSIEKPKSPYHFDNQLRYQIQGITHEVKINQQVDIIQSKHSMEYYVYQSRKWLAQQISKISNIPTYKGVLTALLIGDKSFIRKPTYHEFQVAGTLHVLAVSGLHTGIIFFIILTLISPLNNSHKVIKLTLVSVLLWSFILLTGAAGSSVRAGTMLTVYYIAHLYEREYEKERIYCISLWIMLSYNPMQLFDIGFQLSFIAVGGLLFLYTKIESLVTIDNIFGKRVWQLLCLSFTAQLVTFPISIYYFHGFPTYFLLSNLIVVPLISIVLPCTILFIVVSEIPILSDIVLMFLKCCLAIIFTIQSWIATFPKALVSGLNVMKYEMLLLYGIIISSWWSWTSHRKKMIYISVFLSLIWLSNRIYTYAQLSDRRQLVVLPLDKKNSCIGYIYQRKIVWVAESEEILHKKQYVLEMFALKNDILSTSFHVNKGKKVKIDKQNIILHQDYIVLNNEREISRDQFKIYHLN